MNVIRVESLKKVYRTKVKAPGLGASFRALVRPEYRSVTAVDGIDFAVERGEMIAFIGPNGAGKSTTIKMMTGILHPTSGSVEVLGFKPERDRQALSYKIGTVFGQKSQLWFHLPPSDSFELLGAIYDIDRAQLKVRTDELVERFGIGEFIDVPVRKLSLGQRIRCEVAASFLHEPEILFLDEPTIGLDVVVKRQIRELIKELNRERGTTVFLTSHDAGDVEQLCRRAMIIDRGVLIIDQSVERLKQSHFKRKVVAVRYQDAVDPVLPEGMAIKRSEDGLLRITIDTALHQMDEVMRTLVDQGTVTDITVEDPPMEGIIADIFSGEGRDEHDGGAQADAG